MNAGAQKEKIRQHLECEDLILEALLSAMMESNLISQKGELYSDSEFSITLSSEDDVLKIVY